MKIQEIVRALERFAPLPLQDGFDNAGLQVGLTDVEATGALLCLDVTESVLDEAISLGYNLVISHHPLIFKGYKSITGKDYVERCIMKAIKRDITIYSAHTNLDNLQGGVNFKIAEKLKLGNIRFLDEKADMLLKLVTFVPNDYAGKVQQALFETGCGHIGNYDSCSYQLQGEGTFRAQKNAHPFRGDIGKVHIEPETRIETILPAFKKKDAIHALLASHPYEEPAYDFYSLENTWQQAGAGIIGELAQEMPEIDFLECLKTTFTIKCLRHNTLSGKPVKKVALCGGAGAFLLPKAIGQKADVFITGEIRYHEYFGHEDSILLAEMGHYESEQYTAEILHELLSEKFPQLAIKQTNVNTNPIKYL